VAGFAVGRAAPRIAVPTVARGTAPPRILVDQSGYDLLNIGDAAMLQACVRRLTRIWPDAEVAVLCHDPGRLADLCPDAVPVRLTRWQLPRPRTLRRVHLASAQAWKILGPYVVRPGRAGAADRPPRSWREGLAWADVVVASGGGYLADTWWWHGAGVLSLLAAAQRSGKPTAMFGQGLGPLTHRSTRRQARKVLPRLDVLGLRGGATGEPLARALGVPPRVLTVTGDDAVELVDPTRPRPEPLIGVNLRVTPYAGVTAEAAAVVGTTLRACARRHGAGLLGLPVSLAPGAEDADALRRSLDAAGPATGLVVPDVRTAADLSAAAGRCRVVVTGSYHAAVFALARGVPTVALSGSAYYDAKLGDLRALFPELAWLVPVGRDDTAALLTAAVAAAWDVGDDVRAHARAEARHQRRLGRELYARFARRFRPVPDRPVPDKAVHAGLLRVPA
jgi:polysaccharide pyruvyl transferase WcaK-like protein